MTNVYPPADPARDSPAPSLPLDLPTYCRQVRAEYQRVLTEATDRCATAHALRRATAELLDHNRVLQRIYEAHFDRRSGPPARRP